MIERLEIQQIQEELQRNRLIQKISASLSIGGGIGLIVEANTFGPRIEGWELAVFATTFLFTVGTFGLAGLAKLGEGTFTNRLRYLRHEASRYNPRDIYIPTLR